MVPEGRVGDASDVARPSRRPPSAEPSFSLGYRLVRLTAAWLFSPLLSIMKTHHVSRVRRATATGLSDGGGSCEGEP